MPNQEVLDTIAARKAEREVKVFNRMKVSKKEKLEQNFKAAQKNGVTTSIGPVMKCSFEDASIVRQAAEFFQRQGAPTMTLKDKDGVLHADIAIADALAAADEMAGAYLILWENREVKMAAVEAAADTSALNTITW